MATFSTNQAFHLYVANAYGAVTPGSAAGTVQLKGVGAATLAACPEFCFTYKGPEELLRSDLVTKARVENLVIKDAASMAYSYRKDSIAIDSAYLSGADIDTTKILPGTEMIMHATFFQNGSLSQESQYVKHASTTVLTGMSASTFYRSMATNLKLNLLNEPIPLLKVSTTGAIGGLTITADPEYTFTVDAGATTTTASKTGNVIALTVATADDYADLQAAIVAAGIPNLVVSAGTPSDVATATALVATAIIVEELPQPWVLGKKRVERLQYNLVFTTNEMYSANGGVNSVTVINWCTTDTILTSGLTTVGNGKLMADREWFYMGERGDIYRGVNYPHDITTSYLVDPSKTYDTIEFDYSYVGTGIGNIESAKHICIACDAASTHAVANALIADLKTVLGITIADLT